MNSNWKLLPAALFVAVLALAGCGGSSSDDMPPPPPPQPTPEEQCLAGDGVVYEGGVCKTAEDLRQEGRDAKAEAEAAAAATKAAVALYNVLGVDANVPSTDGIVAVAAGIKAADKSSQSTKLQGDMFSAFATASSDLTESTVTGLSDYWVVAAGSYSEVEADVFGGIAQKSHDANATTGDRNDFVTTGTLRGVSGMLRCNGTCTSQDGHPTGGTWSFKPNNAMDRVTGPKIEWGWWLARTEGAVSAVHRFRNDENATGLAVSASLGDLGSGTASYEGDAAGQYAVVGDSGAFEATASLTATFGGAAIPLSGSIHTFTGADGESRDWMVELKAIADATTTGVGDYANGTTVWGGNEMANAWNADMYNGSGTVTPNMILGDFRAASQGGRMTGVFGATLQE